MLTVELAQDAVKSYGARLLLKNSDQFIHLIAKPRIGFGLAHELDGDCFEFEPSTSYLGEAREDEDTLYERDQFVPVNPGIPLVSLVNLSRYYDLPASGTARVRYNAMHDLDGQPALLTSNWVEFDFNRD